MYSLVVLDFQSTWKEDETSVDLQDKYSTLIKLTRLVTRDGKPLNSVRADFRSSETVKQLLNQGKIEINCMKLRVRPYFAPIKINKCRKCFKHDHSTSQCTSQQLCFKCGQHHIFDSGCNNEIKCVNCQQHHYSGHSSCPVVQQKRKQITEQQKLHRAQMLIKQQQQQHVYSHNPSLFPSLPSHSDNFRANTQFNSANATSQSKNQPSYASVIGTKSVNKHENLEQMVMAMTESINYQLSNFTLAITSQISELAKKINTFNDRVQNIEQQIEKVIIPAIREISKIIDDFSEHKDQTQAQEIHQHPRTTSCQKIVQTLIQRQQPSVPQTPRHKRQRQITDLTQIQKNYNNNTQ
jgi:hypothetical protein